MIPHSSTHFFVPINESKSRSAPAEQGAILILLVILSVSLLVITGLAIDTGLMAVSRAQHRQTAELLALRALREYISSPAPAPVNKLLDAREKAEALLGIEVFLGQSFREHPEIEDSIIPSDNSLMAGPSGRIVPGVWHYRPALDANGKCEGSTPCPCTTNGEFAGACFEPINLNDTSNFETGPNGESRLRREINAMRAELRLREESPLKTVFSRVSGGDPTYTMESASTAAVFPSHAVFLLPLSRYEHMETHIPYERGSWTGDLSKYSPSESAFRITEFPPPSTPAPNSAPPQNSCAADHANPCKSVSSPPYLNNCKFEGGLFPDLYTTLYVNKTGANLRLLEKTRNATMTETRRAQDDYKCYNVSYKDKDAAKSESYLVDSYRGATVSKTYFGPEPLTTYLEAINYGLNLVYQRNIPGDRVGLLAFDQSTTVDKRRILPTTTNSDDYRRLLRVTDTDISNMPNFPSNAPALHDSDHDGNEDLAANRLIERIEQTMLFVRADAQANLPAALDQARLMLINETANPELVENIVVLLGNGVSNCIGALPGPGNCGRDQNTFVLPSIDAASSIVTEEYVPDNIHLHMIAGGDVIQPHTVVRKGSSGPNADVCMGEQETQELGLNYIDWSTPTSGNPEGFIGPAILRTPQNPPDANAAYFFFPNKLYDAVRATRGNWAPLRVACRPNELPGAPDDVASCNRGALKKALDGRCALETSASAKVTNIPNMIDGAGRLYCDPYCRSQKQQAHDAIDRIFSRSPFVLVE